MQIKTVEQWFEVTYDRKAGHGIGPESFPIYHLGVGYYRRPEPEFAGSVTCQKCGRTLHDHGWIDSGQDGHDVCPGEWIVTTRDGENLPLPVWALQRAAQAWQEPSTERFVMNGDLARAFAGILIHSILQVRSYFK